MSMKHAILPWTITVLLAACVYDRGEVINVETNRTGCPENMITIEKGCEERSFIVCNHCLGEAFFYTCGSEFPRWTGGGFTGSLVLSECLRSVPHCIADDFHKISKPGLSREDAKKAFAGFLWKHCIKGPPPVHRCYPGNRI
jgi:hypothetical protein